MSGSQLLDIASYICKEKNYTLKRFVGNGAFKETFLIVIMNTNYALKIADPRKINIERLKREISSTENCHSQYIVTTLENGSIQYEGNQFYYIIEEYLDGGTLTDKLQAGQFTKKDIIPFTKCIISAIECLKNNDLVHRDIKPVNIMFHSGSNIPILVDFGLVRDLRDFSLTKSFLAQGPGTPFYASPEQLNNEKSMISWKSDQFSLGIVLGYCLTGFHPFGDNTLNPEEAVHNVASKNGPHPWFIDKMHAENFSFICRMVEPWPIKRFHTIEDWQASIN